MQVTDQPMSVEEAQAAFAECEAELARRTLLGFTQYTNRSYRPSWHHAALAKALDAVVEGTIKRLMVFMPPQNGKSELVSRRFPAYVLGRNPDARVIACSYNAALATDMSRDVQKIMDQEAYRRLFPGTRLAGSKDAEVKMAAQFGVVGREGSYRAAGVGQGITGKSMTIGVVDDPIKSRAEAESEAYRRMVWNWWVSDFTTRQTGHDCGIVVTQTRWHMDDLSGRLLRAAVEDALADQWHVIEFPAVCVQERPGDPRKVDEALWPTQFSRAWLESKRVSGGSYDWSALYQQRPTPSGGALFKRAWFTRKEMVARGQIIRRCRAWDFAATKPTPGRDPDWTVGTLVAQLSDGRWFVEHVVRIRETPGVVQALVKSTAQMDGRQTLVRWEEEGGSSGKTVTAALIKLLPGWDCAGIRSTGEKSTRWRSFAIQAEANNVVLPLAASWEREWMDELAVAPHGLHDDQCDSVALAFNQLAEHKDLGPGAASVLPGDPQTVSGPTQGAWQQRYFKR